MQMKLIEFPCQFPIKIMGLASDEFESIIIGIINQYVPDLGEGAITSKLSKEGKYVSITATIRARSQIQLDSLYQALHDTPEVLMVL